MVQSYKVNLTVLLVFSLFCVPLRSQADDSISLKQAVELGLANNREYQQKLLSVELAEALTEQAGAWPNPELEVGYANDRFFDDADQYHLTPGIRQKFPVAGRLSYEGEVASLGKEASHAELLDEQRRLKGEIHNTYRSIWILDKALAANEELKLSLSQILAVMEKRASKAELSVAEVNNQKLELDRLALNSAQLQAERKRLASSLNLLLVRETQEQLLLSDPFPKTLDAEYLQNLVATVLERRPDRKQLALQVQQMQRQVSLSEAERWEDWTVGLEYNREVEGAKQSFDRERNEYLGIRLSVPLPLWNQSRGKIKAAEIELAQAQLAIQSEDQKIRGAAQLALDLLLSSKALFDQFSSTTLPLAEKSRKVLEKNYAAGILPFTDLIQAQKQQAEVREDYLEVLEAYAGRLADFEMVTNWFGEG